MIVLYHLTKTPNNFLYRWGLNLRSLIQLSETLPIELIGTHTTNLSMSAQQCQTHLNCNVTSPWLPQNDINPMCLSLKSQDHDQTQPMSTKT